MDVLWAHTGAIGCRVLGVTSALLYFNYQSMQLAITPCFTFICGLQEKNSYILVIMHTVALHIHFNLICLYTIAVDVEFTQTTYSAHEDSGVVWVCVELEGETHREVSVNVMTIDGTAKGKTV